MEEEQQVWVNRYQRMVDVNADLVRQILNVEAANDDRRETIMALQREILRLSERIRTLEAQCSR